MDKLSAHWESAVRIRMGNALSSDSACPMEEDILRFIESDSFKFLIAEVAADKIEELDVRKKRKRNVIQRCTPTFGKRTGARCS